MMTDHTETPPLLQELMHRAEATLIGVALGRILHDINNPLNGISMNAELGRLLVQEQRSAELAEVFDRILNDVRRCAALVSELRNRTRTETPGCLIWESMHSATEDVAAASAAQPVQLECADRSTRVAVESFAVTSVLTTLMTWPLRDGADATCSRAVGRPSASGATVSLHFQGELSALTALAALLDPSSGLDSAERPALVRYLHSWFRDIGGDVRAELGNDNALLVELDFPLA